VSLGAILFFDVHAALDTIRSLEFIRVCGSDGERRGMDIIARRLDEIGVAGLTIHSSTSGLNRMIRTCLFAGRRSRFDLRWSFRSIEGSIPEQRIERGCAG